MGKDTRIEWAHHTVNFWWGCTKVSDACTHCYAETLDNRRKYGGATHWGAKAPRWLRTEKAINELFALNASAMKRHVRERVFINSMSDTFEDHPDLVVPRQRALTAIEGCEHLDILLLTKRPQNVERFTPRPWKCNWPKHVWLGTTVENQKQADIRIPQLLKVRAWYHFLSCEPLLGEVDIDLCERRCPDCGGNEYGRVTCQFCEDEYNKEVRTCGIDWVICGGESGHGSRPMHPDWARALRDRCVDQDVAFFFKQWGDWIPATQKGKRLTVSGVAPFTTTPAWTVMNGQQMARIGKKATGRVLDGFTWDEVPR